MSKRYGRNQKRAAKQRIADLERKAAICEEVNRTALTIVEIAKRISPHSVVFEPDDINSDHYYRMSLEDLPFSLAYQGRPCRSVRDLMHVSLHDLELALETDEFQQAVHFIASFNGRRAAYRMSIEAFKYSTVNQIAHYLKFDFERVLMELVEHLKLTNTQSALSGIATQRSTPLD